MRTPDCGSSNGCDDDEDSSTSVGRRCASGSNASSSSNSSGSGMCNRDIARVLRRTCPDFWGVFSADTIPPFPPQQSREARRFSLVCNLSKVDEPGSHFVSIVSFPRYVLYLDSLGLPCTSPHIREFLRQLKTPTFYNTLQVQDLSSDFCGLYCILFILHFSLRDSSETSSPLTGFQWEQSNLLLNDIMCAENVLALLNKVAHDLYFRLLFVYTDYNRQQCPDV